ncbi:NAD(P)-binding domain protein [Metarhizium guizhouense ARSEF 977]|uniref:NAD(P)-binding domain protein n=1 Tax=Metarhizium guizhouense (strain ARSEF 977) TaxID=1276136 RepID=A0A0B4H201_METGA|nr:NAD(P)-binding domain protein [Metarhizium guizhouense ARSEF 977]
MEAAKEAVQKVVHPASGDKCGTTQDKPGLERDMAPKPNKVHLQHAEEGKAPYIPCGKLKGKNAVITGGDSGIGQSVAILFAMEEAQVAVVYLPAEEQDAQHTKAQLEKNGGEIVLIASDLSHSVNCTDVAERIKAAFGTVDILVNNAATRNEKGTIFDISEYVDSKRSVKLPSEIRVHGEGLVDKKSILIYKL